jgi:hypothetical protein
VSPEGSRTRNKSYASDHAFCSTAVRAWSMSAMRPATPPPWCRMPYVGVRSSLSPTARHEHLDSRIDGAARPA